MTGVVLVFDGDCGFCTTSAAIARRLAPGLTVVPWQRVDLASLGLDVAACADAVQLVRDDGTHVSGAAAVAGVLRAAGGLWAALGRLMDLPGLRVVAAAAYRVVARNRHLLPGGTPACRTPPG